MTSSGVPTHSLGYLSVTPVCVVTVEDAAHLHAKFCQIDTDGSGQLHTCLFSSAHRVASSGIVELDEFFEYLGEEKTLFATQLFMMIGEKIPERWRDFLIPCVRR